MVQSYEKITKVLAASLGITADELVRCYQRATIADLAAICELMCLGFGVVENLGSEIIAWRYFNYSKNISDIFVLRYQGHLIGAVGAEPIKVKVGDKEYDGIRAADIVVHPDHMKRGIGAWMNLHLQHSFPIVMAMGSNENSNTLVRRLFKPMNCRHHFKILFSIKSYLDVRGWPPLLANIVAMFSILPLALNRAFYLQSLPRNYALTPVDNTRQLALLFSDSEYHPPNANIVLRSAEYCRWRYDLNPKSGFKALELSMQNRCVGYAIIKNGAASKMHDWQIMDWDLLPKFRDQKHLRILFGAAVKYAVKDGAQSLSVMASDPLSCDSLRQTGFSHRALDDGFFLFANASVDPAIFNESRWFLSLCDTDESL